MSTTLVLKVDDNLHPDVKALAIAVLRGDESAIRPMLDCQLENIKEGPRITPDYVEQLEDCLSNIKSILIKSTYRNDDPYNSDTIIYDTEIGTIYSNIFKLERYARTLGRQGLS